MRYIFKYILDRGSITFEVEMRVETLLTFLRVFLPSGPHTRTQQVEVNVAIRAGWSYKFSTMTLGLYVQISRGTL